MKNQLLADRYPVHVLELDKSETSHRHLDGLLQALESTIEADPVVAMIAVFDHDAHTALQGGEIRPEILAAKNLIFGSGRKLPGPAMMAVHPRSIGIAELPDRFVPNLLAAPMAEANRKMTARALDLRKAK